MGLGLVGLGGPVGLGGGGLVGRGGSGRVGLGGGGRVGLGGGGRVGLGGGLVGLGGGGATGTGGGGAGGAGPRETGGGEGGPCCSSSNSARTASTGRRGWELGFLKYSQCFLHVVHSFGVLTHLNQSKLTFKQMSCFRGNIRLRSPALAGTIALGWAGPWGAHPRHLQG